MNWHNCKWLTARDTQNPRCWASYITAKQNSKGKKQWFIGYKAHLATDDYEEPMSFAVTGASVHDSKVAVPLMKKKTKEITDFWYALPDKGYISPVINDYVDMVERKVIIDCKAYKGGGCRPLGPRFPEAVCCKDHLGEDQQRAQGRVPSRHYL